MSADDGSRKRDLMVLAAAVAVVTSWALPAADVPGWHPGHDVSYETWSVVAVIGELPSPLDVFVFALPLFALTVFINRARVWPNGVDLTLAGFVLLPLFFLVSLVHMAVMTAGYPHFTMPTHVRAGYWIWTVSSIGLGISLLVRSLGPSAVARTADDEASMASLETGVG